MSLPLIMALSRSVHTVAQRIIEIEKLIESGKLYSKESGFSLKDWLKFNRDLLSSLTQPIMVKVYH